MGIGMEEQGGKTSANKENMIKILNGIKVMIARSWRKDIEMNPGSKILTLQI